MEQPYIMSPRRVTPEFESVCRAVYPNIDADPFYRTFLEYLLFSTWYDKDDTDGTEKLITRDIFWSMGKGFKGHARMQEWFEKFEKDMGIPLNATWGAEGRCTIVRPEIDQKVLESLVRNLTYPVNARNIYLRTGKRVNANRARGDAKSNHQNYLDMLSDIESYLDDDSEKSRLLSILNTRTAKYNASKLPGVCSHIKKFLSFLPLKNASGFKYRKYSLSILDSIEHNPWFVYMPGEKTERVHACFQNMNSLPKLLRKLTCAYIAEDHPDCCVELDLSLAQLAIAASRWNMPILSKHLQLCMNKNTSTWSVFLKHCGLRDEYKDIIKKTVYSLCYGMSKRNLRKQFIYGVGKNGKSIKGVNDYTIWRKFTKHPIIRELFTARRNARRCIRDNKGCEDASGKWIGFDDNLDINANIRSIMACSAQSWEQHIMYAMIPILERYPRIRILSWLHDGVTLYFSQPDKMRWQLDQILDAVNERAGDMGVKTRLEVEYLEPGKLRDKIAREIAGDMFGYTIDSAA